MRVTDLLDREHAFKYMLGLILAVIFFVVVSGPAQSLAGFYDELDGLSDSAQRGSVEQVGAGLERVTAFYEQSRGWGLQWIAEAYLFRDAFLQQASYRYLAGDYEAVVRDLSDEVDDPRASYLLASAKFQLARRQYRAIPDDDPDGMAMKAAIIQDVLEDVNADFERALRSDETDRFEYKWNYDLTSNPDAVRLALEPLRQLQAPELEQMKGEGTPTRRRRG
jgi:hypothetical protein